MDIVIEIYIEFSNSSHARIPPLKTQTHSVFGVPSWCCISLKYSSCRRKPARWSDSLQVPGNRWWSRRSSPASRLPGLGPLPREQRTPACQLRMDFTFLKGYQKNKTETMCGLQKPKVFALRPFIEKVCRPLLCTVLAIRCSQPHCGASVLTTWAGRGGSGRLVWGWLN